MSFGTFTRVKAARVEKKCIWCWTPCEIGQPRVGYFGEFEQEMQDWHMHPECYDAYEREDDGDRLIHDEKHKRGMTCGEMMDKGVRVS
jgi:hypothetical protein